MNPVILTSVYWPNVQYFTKLYAAPYVVMEHNDHYVKQTYRNRCIIEGPDGPLTLTVPVEHGGVAKPTTGEVRVSEHGNWRHLHWNALVSAYEKSPYFFYYADEFRPFYEQRFDRLVELNGAIVAKVCELLDLRPKIILAENYHQVADGEQDLRELIRPKTDFRFDADFTPSEYYQVFRQKLGFLPNLSIADLLFNMGPESRLVLKRSIV